MKRRFNKKRQELTQELKKKIVFSKLKFWKILVLNLLKILKSDFKKIAAYRGKSLNFSALPVHTV